MNVIACAANTNPETINPDSLIEFKLYPTRVQHLLSVALKLAGRNIHYQYGSANPSMGGMDCSGTIYYLLNSMNIKNPPRSSYELYQWIQQKGHFYPITTTQFDNSEWSHLKPGDLLFWAGTYKTGYTPNVSHTMIYLGKNKLGQPLMIGASDGRTYKNRSIYGVSIFDFKLPTKTSNSVFLGYSCIPDINC